jgi:hypothetical protein
MSLFNGQTFDFIDFIDAKAASDSDYPSLFAFAPDNSFLIVGTKEGQLLSYLI